MCVPDHEVDRSRLARDADNLNTVAFASPPQNVIQVQETTESRRFATHFIRKAEAAQRVHDTIRAAPLPISKTAPAAPSADKAKQAAGGVKSAVVAAATGARKVVWGK